MDVTIYVIADVVEEDVDITENVAKDITLMIIPAVMDGLYL